jgi:hypothetical protein
MLLPYARFLDLALASTCRGFFVSQRAATKFADQGAMSRAAHWWLSRIERHSAPRARARAARGALLYSLPSQTRFVSLRKSFLRSMARIKLVCRCNALIFFDPDISAGAPINTVRSGGPFWTRALVYTGDIDNTLGPNELSSGSSLQVWRLCTIGAVNAVRDYLAAMLPPS